MTANQINYAKMIEEHRHNIVTEGQTGMANRIAERNAETNRLNAMTNQYSANVRAAELAELARSNRANELLVAQKQAEIARHNEESERQEHERNYNERVANSLKQRDIDVRQYLGELNARTSERNANVQTVVGSTTQTIGNLINAGVSILRFVA